MPQWRDVSVNLEQDVKKVLSLYFTLIIFFRNSMAQEKSADSEVNTGLRMLTLIASKKMKKLIKLI